MAGRRAESPAVYAGLPAQEKPVTGILTGNCGEAGAINPYGSAYGLPKAISGVNSYWLRGYGGPPPQTVILRGMSSSVGLAYLSSCSIVGRVTNRYGVSNEEDRDHPSILLCRRPRQPWPEMWKWLRSFGLRA